MNRHRVEVYILDAKGQIASVFERIHWNEQEVVDRAIEVLNERQPDAAEKPVARKTSSPIFGALASLALAFFPKCPICWAAYLSFWNCRLDRIPYSPWLQPMLATAMLINLASVAASTCDGKNDRVLPRKCWRSRHNRFQTWQWLGRSRNVGCWTNVNWLRIERTWSQKKTFRRCPRLGMSDMLQLVVS